MKAIGEYISSVERENVLIALWLRGYKSQSTKNQYSRVVKLFLRASGAKSLSEVNFVQINLFLSALSSKHSTKTVSAYRAALASLFSALIDYGYIKENPMARVQKFKVKKEDVFRFLPSEMMEKMIEAANPGRERAMMMVLYWTFMRISECLSLSLSSFIVGYSNVDIIITGKGNKIRKIRISKEKFDKIMDEFELSGDGIVSKNDPLFKSFRGTRLSRHQAWRIYKKISIKAGAGDKPSPHWSRHGGITAALKRGASLKSVQRMAGHESIESTSIYQNIDDDKSPSDFL